MALVPNKNTLSSGTGSWTLAIPANASVAIDDPPTRAPIGPPGEVVPQADYALFPTVQLVIDLKSDNNATVIVTGDASTKFPNPPDSIGFTANANIQIINDTGHPLQGVTLGLQDVIPQQPYNRVPGVVIYGESVQANYPFFSQIQPVAGQTTALFDASGQATTAAGAAPSTISLAGPIAAGASVTTTSVIHNTEKTWDNDFTLTVADKPEAAPHFVVADATTKQTFASVGTPFPGAGLNDEIILATADNINVAALTPMSFIQTGSGTDAIDASGVTGPNVLDGGTGSNLLIGGAGNDQFNVNALGGAQSGASTWSAVRNFHPGDTAIILGASQANVTTLDSPGPAALPGNPGLTWQVAIPGQPTTDLTLVGFTAANLNHFATSFGMSGTTPFMMITETA